MLEPFRFAETESALDVKWKCMRSTDILLRVGRGSWGRFCACDARMAVSQHAGAVLRAVALRVLSGTSVAEIREGNEMTDDRA